MMMQIYSNTKQSKKITDGVKAMKRRKVLSQQERRKMLTQQEQRKVLSQKKLRKMLSQQDCEYLEEDNTKTKPEAGTEKQGTECQGITLIH